MPRLAADLTPQEAARALGLKACELAAAFEQYRNAGLVPPRPDPVTGRYDREAFERFRRSRNPEIFPDTILTAPAGARHADEIAAERRRRRAAGEQGWRGDGAKASAGQGR